MNYILYGLVLVLFMTYPTLLFAQWEQVGESLYGIDYMPNGTIVSVGEFGRIYSSFDNGNTWMRNVIPTKKDLYSVDFATNQIGVAVGDSGTIIRTTDGGYSWSNISLLTKTLLRRIYFLENSLIGIAVGEQGTIIKTTDGGVTWQQSYATTLNDLHTISFTDIAFASSRDWFIVGNKGTIIVSKDSGISWKRLPFSPLEAFASISFVDSLHGLLITSKAQTFRTIDGGMTWKRSASVPQYVDFVQKIQMITQSKAWFGGLYFNGKNLAVTNDTGTTWSRDGYEGVPIVQFSATYDIDFYDDNHGIIVGDNSMMMKTVDGGLTWDTLSYLNTRIHPKYGSIVSDLIGNREFTTIGVSPTTGSINLGTFSTGGLVARTMNSIVWKMDYAARSATTINDIEFVAPQYTLMATNDGLFESSNNEISWSEVTNIPIKKDRSISAINFINQDIGMIINNDVVWKTSNSGRNWQNSILPNVQYSADVVLTTPQTAYASTKEQVFKSTDGGNSWFTILQRRVQGFGSFQKMYFQDSLHGFIASTFGSLFKTTDGGITWDSVSVHKGGFMGVRFITDSIGFAYGFPALLMVTNDGGNSWIREYPYPPNDRDSNIFFQDLKILPGDTTLILVGSNTCLQRSFHPKQYTRGSNKNPYLFISITPNHLRLEVAKIIIYGLYSVPTNDLSLRVFDLYGRQIADLSPMLEINASRTIAEVTLYASQFSNGVYLVHFQAGGDSRTERVVITR